MIKRFHSAVLLSTLLLSSVSGYLSAETLHLYAGAGLKQPVEKIVAKFEQETGHKVNIEYGNSGQILTRFELTQQGDLFLPGTADYIHKLQKKQQVSATYPLVKHMPAMVIRKDKAGQIKTYADLANSKLTIGMGDAKAVALGKSGEVLLDKSGYGDALRKKVIVRAATIKQLLFYVNNGDVDAAVISDSDAHLNRDKLVILPTPKGAPEDVTVLALLKTSKVPKEAKVLAGYFTSAEGMKSFAEFGFSPANKPVQKTTR